LSKSSHIAFLISGNDILGTIITGDFFYNELRVKKLPGAGFLAGECQLLNFFYFSNVLSSGDLRQKGTRGKITFKEDFYYFH
jgi:hypothetical protein